MSQKKAAQLTLEVRRIRKSVRAGFIDDYGTCSPKTLAGFFTSVRAAQNVDDDSAGNGKAVDPR